ncbi:MAG TPA: ABC transporter ATP-binding protein [Firmicutes bacterium]|nr:ABC transporter ATP-binding protein [Bacillota bacterium]
MTSNGNGRTGLRPGRAAPASGGIASGNLKAAIETFGLTKFYGKVRGIVDLSLVVPEGQIFGFIGPNGAGKSTTIRTLLGLLRPTRGTARLLGHDVTNPHEAARARAQVGYVPGEVNYYDNLRVADLLAYSASFYPNGNTAECVRRRHELAELLDLDLSRRIDALSLGNRKKVALIQALQHRPRLLILDEPTSGLDPLVQARLFELLRAENRAGMTVFFSSHVLNEVQRLCDSVAIIRDGRLVTVEDVETLRARQVRRVKVTLPAAGEAQARATVEPLLSLPGVSDARWESNHTDLPHAVSFLYSGHPRELLSTLASIPVSDVLIEEPSLEEIFLQYYGDYGVEGAQEGSTEAAGGVTEQASREGTE